MLVSALLWSGAPSLCVSGGNDLSGAYWSAARTLLRAGRVKYWRKNVLCGWKKKALTKVANFTFLYLDKQLTGSVFSCRKEEAKNYKSEIIDNFSLTTTIICLYFFLIKLFNDSLTLCYLFLSLVLVLHLPKWMRWSDTVFCFHGS